VSGEHPELSRRARVLWILILFAVLAAGTGLRFYRLDWSEKDHPHPDENMVVIAMGRITLNQFDPDFFAYGSLPIYLYRFAHFGLRRLASKRHGLGWDWAPTDYYVVGRMISAFLGSLTLLLVFLLARRLFGLRAGVLATTFLAFTLLHVKLSHFLTVDVDLTFFVIATLYFASGLLVRRRLFDYVFAGICLGLAMATKISAFPGALAILVAHLIGLWHRRRPFDLLAWIYLLLVPLFVLGAFAVSEPFAFLSFKKFFQGVSYQAMMVRGKNIPWYVLHFEDSKPLIYHLRNYLLWSTGVPLGLLTFGSFLITLYWAVRRLDGRYLFLHSFALPYFVMVFIMTRVKFIRYQIPVVPVFCIFGAAVVVTLIDRWRGLARRRLLIALTWGAVLSAILFCLAFTNIYRHPTSRVTAAQWIADNVPEGSKILTQAMEVGLPWASAEGYRPGRYEFVEVNIISEPRSERALLSFAEKVASVDYIVLPNPGHYNLVLSDPEKHERMGNYFRNLFAEQLGFRLVQSFVYYPRLGPFELDSSLSDVGFYFFDHPKVQVFKRVKELSAAEIARKIKEPDPDVAAMTKQEILRARAGGDLPARYARRSGGTRNELKQWPPRKLHYAIWWYLLAQVLAFLALPFTLVLFRRLPGAGYGFSKVLGIVVSGWLSWILISLGVIKFDRGGLLFAIALMTGISLYCLYRRPGLLREFAGQRGMLKSAMLAELVFLVCYLIILGVKAMNPDIRGWERPSEFAYFNAVFRSETYPPYDPWISGEPLNYYYYCWHLIISLTKLLGIETQYSYTLGLPLVAGLVGVAAFSLVLLATGRRRLGLFAVLAINFVGNFDAIRQVMSNNRFWPFDWFRSAHSPIKTTISEFPYWSYLYGDLHPHVVVIPVVAVFLGFLYKLLHSRAREVARFGEQAWEQLLQLAVMMIVLGTVFATNTWDYPTESMLLGAALYLQWWRVRQQRRRGALPRGYELRPGPPPEPLPPTLSAYQRGWLRQITESRTPEALFRFFGTLGLLGLYVVTHLRFGYFVLLVLWLLGSTLWDIERLRQQRRIGSLLAAAGSAYGPGEPRQLPRLGFFRRAIGWVHGLFQEVLFPTGVIVAGAFMLFAPYQLNFTKSPPVGVDLTIDIGRNLIKTYTSALPEVLVVFGHFLFVLVVLLLLLERQFTQERGRSAARRTFWLLVQWGVLAAIWYATRYRMEDIAAFLGDQGWSFLEKYRFQIDYATVLFLTAALVSLLRALFLDRMSDGLRFGLLLSFMAVGIIWGDDIIYVKDFLAGGDWRRMNSVFKFHYQACYMFSFALPILYRGLRVRFAWAAWEALARRWLLVLLTLAATGVWICREAEVLDDTVLMAAGVLLGCYLLWRLGRRLYRQLGDPRAGLGRKLGRVAFGTGFDLVEMAAVALLATSCLFVFTGTHQKIRERSNGRGNIPTLNGLAFKVRMNPQEYDAIMWLRENVKGHPVILETTGKSYQAYSRISMNTGLPTLLGWASHVYSKGYTWQEVFEHSKAIDTIYDTTDIEEAMELIRKFNIAFIYVGYLERERHDPFGLQKFDRYPNFFGLVYRNPKVSIYEVRGHRYARVRRVEEKEETRELAAASMLVGGPGSEAGQFLRPQGIWVDRGGNFFVADAGNHRVQVFDSRGRFLFSLGGRGSGDGELFWPAGVGVAADRSIFVADTGNNRVQKFDSAGGFLLAFNGPDGGFLGPRDVAVSASGRVYVADTGNDRICVYSLDGVFIESFGGPGGEPGRFRFPAALALDPQGLLYVADVGNARIQVFDGDGSFRSAWSVPLWSGPGLASAYIAVDGRKQVFVTSPLTGEVAVYSDRGEEITTAVLGKLGDRFEQPTGIAVLRRDVYVVDAGAGRIERLVKEEPVNMFVGGEGSKPGQFVQPRGIAVGPDDTVYVIDFRNERVQHFTANGEFIAKWGSKGEDAGQFRDPCGIAVGKDGSVYVADTWNQRIQKFTSDGELLKIWKGEAGGFYAVRDVAVDDDMNRVYAVDTGNGRIQVFTRDGRFVTTWGSRGAGALGMFREPVGIAVGPDHRIYVADVGNNRVQVLGPSGRPEREIPVPEWEARGQEAYLAVGPNGTLYLTAPHNGMVIRYGPDGRRTGVCRRPRNASKWNTPAGIAVSSKGEIYVMEMMEPRVRKLTDRDFRGR
jgi:uncharacterized membrane protein/DNA-binding beta-propeller fold protein YncE